MCVCEPVCVSLCLCVRVCVRACACARACAFVFEYVVSSDSLEYTSSPTLYGWLVYVIAYIMVDMDTLSPILYGRF